MITLLDLLLATWIFWPLVSILSVTALLILVAKVLDIDRHSGLPLAPLTLFSLALGGVAYHYSSLHAYVRDWHAWAYALGGYIAVGFAVSMYKWVMALVDFRKDQSAEVKGIIKETRDQIENKNPNFSKRQLAERTVEMLNAEYRSKTIASVNPDDTVSVCLNWRAFPIATWWTYWPYFILSVILDPIQRLVSHALVWLRDIFHRTARFFSINA